MEPHLNKSQQLSAFDIRTMISSGNATNIASMIPSGIAVGSWIALCNRRIDNENMVDNGHMISIDVLELGEGPYSEDVHYN